MQNDDRLNRLLKAGDKLCDCADQAMEELRCSTDKAGEIVNDGLVDVNRLRQLISVYKYIKELQTVIRDDNPALDILRLALGRFDIGKEEDTDDMQCL